MSCDLLGSSGITTTPLTAQAISDLLTKTHTVMPRFENIYRGGKEHIGIFVGANILISMLGSPVK
jgi:hypothetical protein